MKNSLKNITGIILAGGKSSRMGTEKGLVKVKGKRLIDHAFDTISKVSNQTIIISNQKYYNGMGVYVFSDVYKGKGPAGGIHTGLSHSSTKWNVIVACDMPNLSFEVLLYLLSHLDDDYDAIVPIFHNNKQPLCALYNRSCLGKLEHFILKGELKMMDILSEIKIKVINITEDLEIYSPYLFGNVNTIEDVSFVNNMTNEG